MATKIDNEGRSGLRATANQGCCRRSAVPFLWSERVYPVSFPAIWLAISLCSASANSQPAKELSPPAEVGAAPAPSNEFDLPIDPTASASADELIGRLGSPLFQERERATEGLIEIGAPAFAKLRAAYRATDDLEVRVRIERIVRTAYLNHHVYDRSGFLGINLQAYVANLEEHPLLPKGTVGVRIGRVIPQTAAERAGLLEGDIIFEVDGEPIRGEGGEVVETFSATIRTRGPGGKMKLTILRAVQRIPVDVTIGRCPEQVAREGSVRQVSENHYKAMSRFPQWWESNFLAATPEESLGDPKAPTDSD